MKKLHKLVKDLNSFLLGLSILFLGFLILFGVYSFFGPINSSNPSNPMWELVLFSFIIGTLILTIPSKILGKQQKSLFPKLGTFIILAALIILMGNGIGFLVRLSKLSFLIDLGNLVIGIGILLLSLGLGILFLALGDQYLGWYDKK